MVRSSDVIAAARAYLGVQYQHQGRTRNGLDCIGLVICVAHDLGLTDFEINHYARVPSNRMMQRLLSEHCTPIDLADTDIGDLIHLAFDRQPQHLAIVTDKGMIHADNQYGVVEHTLSLKWLNRVRGAYHLPGVVNG